MMPDNATAAKTENTLALEARTSNIHRCMKIFNGGEFGPHPETGKIKYLPGPITHDASQSFVDAIYNEIHTGYGFTPMLGAGFSVSAGIPIIYQLATYLQRCICVALGVEEDSTGKDSTRQLWNPRTDRWPPLIDRSRMDQPEDEPDWMLLMRKRLDQETQKKDEGYEANPAIYQEAYGAMAEWRSSLFFISRIVFDRPREQKPTKNKGYEDPELIPRLEQPSQSVIDAGWREWMRDKRPTLNHRLLAALSGLLRIDTILTTNFDDLIERAFEESRNPLQVFDVRLMDGLPEFGVVARGRSIIKMHGSTRSLRADYSLDGEPSAEDKKLFCEYLAGQRLTETSRFQPEYNPQSRKHLLVSGIAATEARTTAFITHALRALPDLKVFWVAYTEEDVHRVVAYAERLPRSETRGPIGEPRILCLRHTEIGLLFLHLFQSIRKTIPSNNAVYPSLNYLSIPPLPKTPPDKLTESNEYKGFRKRVKEHIEKHPLCLATAPKGVAGVTTACAEVFRALESKFVCMWIEMNDINSIDELFEVIQETAYSKLGQRDWTPLYAAGDDRPRELEVKRLADASSKEFLLFINAREKPGSNREFGNKQENAWLDDEYDWQQLDRLLSDLRRARKNRFRVVLLCHDHQSPLATRAHRFVKHTIVLRDIPRDKPDEVIDKTFVWVKEGNLQKEERLHFLHTLALMQRSRHLAITWARCAGQPGNLYWSESDKHRLDWLSQLEGKGLLRRKDGGFIWMHSHLREGLRTRFLFLEDSGFQCKRRADIQHDISLWYLKVFDASGTPPAIFEAVDHLCFSAAHLIVGTVKALDKGLSGIDEAKELLDHATRRVHTARQLLQEHTFLIHTQGYPRASSRRLKYISDFWLNDQWMTQALKQLDPERNTKLTELLMALERSMPTLRAYLGLTNLREAICELQLVSAKIGLLIAREIGEDRQAYLRLQILAVRLMRIPWLRDEEIIKRLASRPLKRVRTKDLKLHELIRSILNRRSKELTLRHEWVEWWLDCGLLGIASRSYKEAEKSLYRAISVVKNTSIKAPSTQEELEELDWNRLSGEIEAKFAGTRRKTDTYLVYLKTIYALQEAANLQLLQVNAGARLSALRTSREFTANEPARTFYRMQNQLTLDKRLHRLKDAETLALRGLVLIEAIQDSGIDRPDHDSEMMNHKSRLLQYAGLAALYDPDRKKHSRHAMSMMGDAVAALSEAEPLFARAEQAVIDIRRAEIRLSEAAAIKLFDRFEFETWSYDRLHGDSIHAPVLENMLDQLPPAKTQIAVAIELKKIWQDVGMSTVTHNLLLNSENRLPVDEALTANAQERLRQLAKQRLEINLTEFPPSEQFLQEHKHANVEHKKLVACLNRQSKTNKKIAKSQLRIVRGLEKGKLVDLQQAENIGDRQRAWLQTVLLRDNLREITSRATDALRFLDRAEPILRERRRNVSWTTCYFELRLRAISLILWASIVQEGTAIPYLGLEAAMRKSETEPDQILNDAVRMIRVDSYRLAMIVLTYASCARAFQIRLALDYRSVRLPERLKQMHSNLDHAIRHLETVRERRVGREVLPKQDDAIRKAAVNEVVDAVVDEVLDRVKQVLSGLRAEQAECAPKALGS